MPIYDVYLYPWSNAWRTGFRDDNIGRCYEQALYQKIADLHSKSFSCGPATVRVRFIFSDGPLNESPFGGYGYEPSKKKHGAIKLSDYIVVQMNFNGSPEEWQDYCRRLVMIPEFKRRDVRSVVLQKNVFEFEIRDPKFPGVVVDMGKDEALSSYIK